MVNTFLHTLLHDFVCLLDKGSRFLRFWAHRKLKTELCSVAPVERGKQVIKNCVIELQRITNIY